MCLDYHQLILQVLHYLSIWLCNKKTKRKKKVAMLSEVLDGDILKFLYGIQAAENTVSIIFDKEKQQMLPLYFISHLNIKYIFERVD